MYVCPKLENKDLKKMKVTHNYTNPDINYEIETDVYVLENIDIIKMKGEIKD